MVCATHEGDMFSRNNTLNITNNNITVTITFVNSLNFLSVHV